MSHQHFGRSLTFTIITLIFVSRGQTQTPTPNESPELVLQLGHSGAVTALAFSPDGGVLASGSADGTVKLWNTKTGEVMHTFTEHSGGISAVTFSPDGKMLASGSNDKTVRLWDSRTCVLLKTLTGHTKEVRSVAFSPDSNVLASGSNDNTIRIWDVSNGRLVRTLREHTEAVTCVAFSPEGKTLASGSYSFTNFVPAGEVLVWDVTTWKYKRIQSGLMISSISFSPDGQILVSATKGFTGQLTNDIRLWDLHSGIEKHVKHVIHVQDLEVVSIILTPDGKQLIACGLKDKEEGEARVWDLPTGEVFRTIAPRKEAVISMALSPNGKALATGSLNHDVKIWDVATGQLTNSFMGVNHRGAAIAFSPDGTNFASASGDQAAAIWDARTWMQKLMLGGNSDKVCSIAFSPDSNTSATGCGKNDSMVRTFDLEKHEYFGLAKTPDSSILSLAFSPDSNTLAYGTGYSQFGVFVFDLRERKLKRTLTGYGGNVTSLVFSPDGRYLVSGGEDQPKMETVSNGPGAFVGAFARSFEIWLWDTQHWKLAQVFKGHTNYISSLAFSPDGKTLASGSDDKTVKLWDVDSATLRQTLRMVAEVLSVAFSPDGKTLAIACGDKTVRLWDMETMVAENTILRIDSSVENTVAFSPNGHVIAVGTADGTFRLWKANSGRMLATFVTLPPGREGHVGWLTITRDGYYEATPGSASQFIRWRLGDRLLPEQSYKDTFNKPDLVEKTLNEGDLPEP